MARPGGSHRVFQTWKHATQKVEFVEEENRTFATLPSMKQHLRQHIINRILRDGKPHVRGKYPRHFHSTVMLETNNEDATKVMKRNIKHFERRLKVKDNLDTDR
jgi:hypothetical protein